MNVLEREDREGEEERAQGDQGEVDVEPRDKSLVLQAPR